MPKKVLIVYATRSGTTAQIAETVAKTMTASGLLADIMPVRDAVTAEGYDAVVLGTAIRAGMIMPELLKFVKRNQESLLKIHVAAFAVCLTMKDDTPENRKAVAAYLDPIKKHIKLVSETVLAGAVTFARLGVFARFIIRKLAKAQEGDFRDERKITEWAQEFVKRIKSDEWISQG